MKKYKILIVDDERSLADMTKDSFPQEHFLARACYSGEQALKEVDRDRPDLIVLDVMMPRMDGWEVLAKLKSSPLTSSIPVILCTARDGLDDVERSFRFGAQSFIVKPFAFSKLLEKVAVILEIEKLLND